MAPNQPEFKLTLDKSQNGTKYILILQFVLTKFDDGEDKKARYDCCMFDSELKGYNRFEGRESMAKPSIQPEDGILTTVIDNQTWTLDNGSWTYENEETEEEKEIYLKNVVFKKEGEKVSAKADVGTKAGEAEDTLTTSNWSS